MLSHGVRACSARSRAEREAGILAVLVREAREHAVGSRPAAQPGTYGAFRAVWRRRVAHPRAEGRVEADPVAAFRVIRAEGRAVLADDARADAISEALEAALAVLVLLAGRAQLALRAGGEEKEEQQGGRPSHGG